MSVLLWVKLFMERPCAIYHEIAKRSDMLNCVRNDVTMNTADVIFKSFVVPMI